MTYASMTKSDLENEMHNMEQALRNLKKYSEDLMMKMMTFAEQKGKLEALSQNPSEDSEKLFKDGVKLQMNVMGEMIGLFAQSTDIQNGFTMMLIEGFASLAEDQEQLRKTVSEKCR